MHSIRLFDNDLNLIAALHGAASFKLRYRPNEADQAGYSYPGDTDAVADFEMARNIAIFRGDKEAFTGSITHIDAGDNTLEIRAIGHEDRLGKGILTPPNWQGWNGLDLADMARDVLNRFRFRRFTTQDDWQNAYASQNVNLTIEPGSVMLGLEPYYAGQRFKEHGWIQFRLDLGSDALPTGRIARWSERAGEPTRIMIQSRAAESPTALDAAPWGPEMTAVHVDNVEENEISGVPLADGGRWIDVRVNLYTRDTLSPDDQTNPHYYGRTPILDGLEILWREALEIIPGEIPAKTGIIVTNGEWNRVTHLKALKDECDKAGWRFRVRHDMENQRIVLDLAETFGRDLTHEVVLRHGQNARITALSASDSEYANVLNCWGAGSGIDRLHVRLRDETAILKRGAEIEGDFEYDTDDPVELQEKGQAELQRRSNTVPRFVVSLRDTDLDLRIGDEVTIVDPRSGFVVNDTVTEIDRGLGTTGETVEIAFSGTTLATAIEKLTVAQRKRPRGEVAPKPEVPTNVTVQGYAGGIRIWWTARAESWEIEHTTQVDTHGEPINWTPLAVVTTPYYDHTGLPIGSEHHYRLRSRLEGRVSDPLVFRGLARDVDAPGTPTNFTLSATVEGVGVRFTPPSDEDLDHVEVHLSTQGNFTPAGNDPSLWNGTTQTLYDRIARPGSFGRYDFEGGQVLYSKLVAVDESGNKSLPTDEKSATARHGVDTTPPPAPTLQTPTPEVVDLGDGDYESTVRVPFTVTGTAIRVHIERRLSGSQTWEEIGSASRSPFIDEGNLRPGITYQYRARSESMAGIYSEQYSAIVTATISTAALHPPNVTGLVANFDTADVVLQWQPVAQARSYRVRVLDSNDVPLRTEEVAGTEYTYPYSLNVQDFGAPGSPSVKLSVEARNQFGNYSQTPTVITAVNPPPPAPAIEVRSSLTQLRWEIIGNLPRDWDRVSVSAGSVTEVGQRTGGTIDLQSAGIADGANAQATIYVIDVFGQNGAPATKSTTGRYLTREDMQGALFNIEPRSEDLNGNERPPTSGSLDSLWDLDTSNGATWNAPVRIVVSYPMQWLFDMVRLYTIGSREFFVEIEEPDGNWVKVTGTTNPVSKDGDWTVQRFAGGRLYITRRLRITFPGNGTVDLRGLKFWTIIMGDEILAQVIRLTTGVYIESADGRIKILPNGIQTLNPDNETTFSVETDGGDVFVKGSLWAGELILPVEAI